MILLSNNIVMSHVKCGPYHDDNGTSGQLGDAAPADLAFVDSQLPTIYKQIALTRADIRKLLYNE